MTVLAAEPLSLPPDLLERIFGLCSTSVRDLQAASQVCRSWREAAQRDGPWEAAARRDHPAADPATLAVLRARAAAGPQVSCAGRRAYRALTQIWKCDRCQQEFSDGRNTADACCFHPGILFSGGTMNGAGLRFTCCSRRAHHIPNGSRDGNGCATAFHAGGGSAWQRHAAGVEPRELPPAPGAAASKPAAVSGVTGGSPRAGPPAHAGAQLQEWHPNQRPGLLELPSRLFAASSGAA